MKNKIIIASIALVSFGGIAFASTKLTPVFTLGTDYTSDMRGQVSVYKFTDVANNATSTCYIAVTGQINGIQSSISCIK